VMMEDFGASATATVGACRDELSKCQLMLLIVAYRQGWVPTIEQGGDGARSITALELDFARDRNIPVLVMLANDTWPGRLWEDEATARGWIKAFRANLNLPAEFFDYEDPTGGEEKRLPAFRERTRKVLLSHQERLLAERMAAAEMPAPGLDYFSSARDGVLDGSCIPIVGLGVFGDGPLGIHFLTNALAEKGTEHDACLATVAEYRERLFGARARFLARFRKIVEEQTRQAAFPPALQILLTSDPRPELIVATAHDQMIEDALAAAGRRFVVVTHVLRSADGKHDGKVLVLRRDAAPEFPAADKVETRADELVIYRPLGSPLLHDRLDPAWEIDTVVITEADHLSFLSRLENPQTGVPARFSRLLQRRPLLFLGYGLDVWHYRLIMHVFQSAGGRAAAAHALAVRQPASPMETLAWQRLGADLVPLDPNAFARRVMAPAAAV
jgi:SIR2-like domain